MGGPAATREDAARLPSDRYQGLGRVGQSFGEAFSDGEASTTRGHCSCMGPSCGAEAGSPAAAARAGRAPRGPLGPPRPRMSGAECSSPFLPPSPGHPSAHGLRHSHHEHALGKPKDATNRGWHCYLPAFPSRIGKKIAIKLLKTLRCSVSPSENSTFGGGRRLSCLTILCPGLGRPGRTRGARPLLCLQTALCSRGLTAPRHRWVPGHLGHKSSRSQGLWGPRVLWRRGS